MLKLKLNNTVEVPIASYNRYTNIQEGNYTASANFNFSSVNAYDSLVALSNTTITDIKIYNDDQEIYHLSNQSAHLININENVYEGGMSISANLTFDSADEE